jgi:hypothetical protein
MLLIVDGHGQSPRRQLHATASLHAAAGRATWITARAAAATAGSTRIKQQQAWGRRRMLEVTLCIQQHTGARAAHASSTQDRPARNHSSEQHYAAMHGMYPDEAC